MNEFLSLYLFVENQICKFLLSLLPAQYAAVNCEIIKLCKFIPNMLLKVASCVCALITKIRIVIKSNNRWILNLKGYTEGYGH